MNLDDYIKELLLAAKMQQAEKLNTQLKKMFYNNTSELNMQPQNTQVTSNKHLLQGDITYKNPNQKLYITNNYKNTPVITNQPNTQVMYASPDKLFLDKIMPTVKKSIEWAKNEPNILMNKEIDYSKPMNAHERITDKTIKILRPAYKASSDMYTDGMTDLSRAKKNPNVQVTNIENLDKDLQKKLKNYGVKLNEQGILYNKDSYMSELFSNSPEIEKIKNDHYNDIKQGKKNEFPVDFEGKWYDFVKNPKRFDRHNSIQHGMLTDTYIDENDNLTGKLYDRADFKQREIKGLTDIVNNHGYNMQEKGNFKNYFSVTEINQANKTENYKNSKIIKLLEEFLKMLH